jgi:hypothetical protein
MIQTRTNVGPDQSRTGEVTIITPTLLRVEAVNHQTMAAMMTVTMTDHQEDHHGKIVIPDEAGIDHQAVVEVETVAMEALDTHLLSTRTILGQMSFYTSFTRSSRRRTTLRSHRPCTLASITITPI